MSDYLSSLAARSLRREPSCEPRRPQMFEPRQETSGVPLVEEVHEELSSEETSSKETFKGVATQPLVSDSKPISRTSELNEHDGGVLSEPRAEAPAHTTLHTPTRAEVNEPDFNASPRHTDTREAPRANATSRPLITTPATITTQDTPQTQSQPETPTSQPPNARLSDDEPAVHVQTEQSTRPVVTVRESSPDIVARFAATPSPSHEPSPSHVITPAREVSGMPPPRSTHEPAAEMQAEGVAGTPRPVAPLRPSVPSRPSSPHSNPSLQEPERVTAPASKSEEAPRARPSIPALKTSSASPSIKPSGTADEGVAANRQATQGRGVRAEVVDEGGREQTSTVVPRAVAEARVERVEAKSPTTVVDVEVLPQPLPQPLPQSLTQPLTSKQAQVSESSTASSSGEKTVSDVVLPPHKAAASAEVRPVTPQPQTPNVRASALSTPAEHAVIVQSREAGFDGVRSEAREVITREREAAPTIEVTIGRIEVRAVTPPAPPQQQRQRQESPKMSLDDYLRAHSGGRS